MALLKSLIQRLLDSRTTPNEAAHSAMPSTSETVLLTQDNVYQSWGAIHQGVAADDGYINIYARANNSDNAEMRVLTSGMTFSSGQTNNNMDMGCSAPVAKGQSYAVKGVQVKMIKIIFVKALGAIVGGGGIKNTLLQGGVLCRLSHWYSSLRRSSLLAKRNGSEVKVFSQTQIPEQRSLLTTLRLSFIRLQVMDGLHSAETGHRSMSALPESWERVALTLKVISELQLRFGRGIPLVSIARRTISNRLRQNSFPAKGQRNTSLVGGASC